TKDERIRRRSSELPVGRAMAAAACRERPPGRGCGRPAGALRGNRPERGGRMQFGLLYEIEVPRPWTETSVSDGFWEALEQVKVAEEVGFSHVFSVEHHFLDQFSVASAPEVWLAAVAQHTSKIRIGHGVRLLPFNYTIPSGRRRWLRRSKPVQRPHPPIWMSGTQPESAVLAGERGIGFMHFSLSDPFRDGREGGALLPGHALAIYFMHYNFVRI